MHYVIGTAGHIDHGKSALVKALTGTDPDRLKEEKERGMTTDLGFAFLGDTITIIDVPGHERFVRHMLAGASTIDLVMLVVAADDGVMPQTKEHFEICRLLGIKKGLVVINKIDLVDKDILEMVRYDVAQLVRGSFLENAPVLEVSAKTGVGIPELKAVIQQLVRSIEPKPDKGVFRMPIDRCFLIKGFGTVVAGTILSGRCSVGDRLEILPQGVIVRVRGIQRHNQSVKTAVVGERAAVNIQGIEQDKVFRGNVLITPNSYHPTTIINASLYLLKETPHPLKNMSRVHLHLGTAETMCRVWLLDTKELTPGSEALVQLRTEEPLVCDYNDRFVIRHYSPLITIGGGVVLEPYAKKERRFDESLIHRLQVLKTGKKEALLEEFILKAGFNVKTVSHLAQELAIIEEEARGMVDSLIQEGKLRLKDYEGRYYIIHEQTIATAKDAVRAILSEYHQQNPLRMGIKQPELRVRLGNMPPILLETVLSELSSTGEILIEAERVRLKEHRLKLSAEEEELYNRVAGLFFNGKWNPPDIEAILTNREKALFARVRIALLESGVLVDIGDGILMHSQALQSAEQVLKDMFKTQPEVTASQYRQALGTTRKIVIPLLNYFDRIGLTQRKGDVRVLRRK